MSPHTSPQHATRAVPRWGKRACPADESAHIPHLPRDASCVDYASLKLQTCSTCPNYVCTVRRCSRSSTQGVLACSVGDRKQGADDGQLWPRSAAARTGRMVHCTCAQAVASLHTAHEYLFGERQPNMIMEQAACSSTPFFRVISAMSLERSRSSGDPRPEGRRSDARRSTGHESESQTREK